MKVYAKHHKIQQFLKENPQENITVVDEQSSAHYIITGRYTRNEYHDNLRGIIIPYTGHNGIDLDAMREKDLQLFITPTRSKYVAEKAVSLTLALLGKTIHYHTLLQDGNWAERNSDERVPWTSVQGKTIGLYGFGRIGKIIYKMLKGFDCEFATIDRDKDYPSDVQTVKNLTNLIQFSDIIIIAAPLNETTEGVFNKDLLKRMKRKFLINIGRGKIIDERDLYYALLNKELKGYASDVWFKYPKEKETCYPSSYPIHELPNVVLSNHSGGYTETTNKEVNNDLLKTLNKLKDEHFEDALDLQNLL